MAQRRRSARKSQRWRSSRWLAVGALVLAAAATGVAGTTASLVVTAAPAGAQPVGDCSATTGVIVVVDFAHWGETIERGCAATPTTGYGALRTAGFATAGDVQDGSAYVCRIDTEPAAAQTPCTTTPPISAYWSYWHAVAGQATWSYSQTGAMSYQPPVGSVTVWVFGAGTRPTFSPTTVRVAGTGPPAGGSPPTTTTTAAPPATTSPAATSGATAGGPSAATGGSPVTGGSGSTPPTGANAPGSGAGSSPAPGSSATSVGHAGSTTPTTATTGTTTTTGAAGGSGSAGSGGSGAGDAGPKSSAAHGTTKGDGTPRIVDVDPASARVHPSAGSPLPVIVGGIAIVVVAGAAAGVAWRRRRGSQTE